MHTIRPRTCTLIEKYTISCLLQVPMQPKMRVIPFKATGDIFQDETNGMYACVCLFRRSKHRSTKRFDQ